MVMNAEERSMLALALSALAQGDSRRFEDLLWLGFGDRWTFIQASLVRHHQVRLMDGSRSTYELTEVGSELLTDLAGFVRRAVG